ncbi:Predicted arabinose efflux permease, MFS family [Rhizobiales bacterium GAS191]|jgi:MFS family permease|nr:Predicted arabinose efflux permease, MFS family [Rhizobiales bacterium GAS113]SEC52500.1 Predicted arabinose efflux permease, MFS family [Rhizobiales bacterium GAS188]SEC75410.1 Predicted arabinose efflux permease, MFS family [Rhizobiales bacterium GAS191]
MRLDTPLSYRQLLVIPDLAALLVAAGLSRLAARMFTLVIVLYALGRFASPALAGWLSFAAVAPGLVVSPLAGALLDRIGARRAVILDMAASAALVAVLAAADRLGIASIPVLAALITLYSLTSPLSAAGIRTLLPRLVPAAARDRANALDTALYAATDVVGPALGGLLIGMAGAGIALLGIALVLVGATLSLLRMRKQDEPAARMHPLSFLGDAMDGLVHVVRNPSLRGLAISYSLFQVTWGALVVLVPVTVAGLAGAALRDPLTGFAFAVAAIAAGLGAILAGQLRLLGREVPVMTLGMLVTACAIWPLAPNFGLIGLVLGLVVAGLAEGPVDVGLLTLRQRRTEPHRLGRVLSISISLNISGFPLGSALAGLLAAHSLSLAFAAAAFASLLAALASHALIPKQDAGH